MITNDIPILAIKAIKSSGGGGGTSGVQSIFMDGDTLKYTNAEGNTVVVGQIGNMEKSTYDADNSGVVDNAERVNNYTVETSVPQDAVFTDTVYDDTELRSEVDNKVTASVVGEKLSIQK